MSVDDGGLGETLLERRRSLGWSLADLSERTGLSRAYLNALERGRSKRPGAETVRRLEAALGSVGSSTTVPADAPLGLAQLAAEQKLSREDVEVLAGLRVRGRQPQSKERWSFIYQAMLASEAMDETSTYDSRHRRAADARSRVGKD